MKKNFRIALILSLVCAICAALIAIVNIATKSTIEANRIEKQEKALNELYDGASFKEVDLNSIDSEINENINKVFEVYQEEKIVGYIYNVEGKNSYGLIELMIGINLDKTLEDIVVFNNTQSYKQIVDEHISSEYVPGISVGEVEDIDIYCGATKGAKLTKELVEIAFTHFDKMVGDNND